MVAYLPSPSQAFIQLGPLRLTAYGLMIALGVMAAVELSRRRAPARGADAEDISALALWGVLAGLVGARLYHVITDLSRFRGHWGDVVKVWEGGLGIPGGLIVGFFVGVLVTRNRHRNVADMADIVAPGVALAQAIGRWGNWWNQEIFGRPTTLPWGLKIDTLHRPVGMERFATYHPTFLYESLWNVSLAGLLLLVDRRWRLARGQIVWLYVGGYGLGRLWVESLRIDDAARVGGIRLNLLMAGGAILAGVFGFVLQGRLGRGHRRPGELGENGEPGQDGVVEDGSGVGRSIAEAVVGE